MDKGTPERDETRPTRIRCAIGQPGAPPTWSSGAKTMVGTAACERSCVWFTVGRGTINEIYFPDVDQANSRSVRFLVSDGRGFFSDEEFDAEHTVQWLRPGVPGCIIKSKCKKGRYRIEKEIFCDPVHNALLLHVKFRPRDGGRRLRLYLIAEPHLGDQGADNDGWTGEYKGQRMLFAKRARTSMAIACSTAILNESCGYMGRSDGRTCLAARKPLPDFNIAKVGNIALTAEIDYRTVGGDFVVSVGFGFDSAEAGQQARAGTLTDFATSRQLFSKQWEDKQSEYRKMHDLSGRPLDMYRVSTAVLETHQSKRFPGGFIASLSLPWGFNCSDMDVGGYHVLWPRDMVETAMGKLASGDARSARATLFYLACTQDKDGSWSQNMWLDGTAYWKSMQMDAMALPVLLVDQIRRENALEGYNPAPMMHRAAQFLLHNGPVTEQDRWETTPGYSPYTMATQVAALLAAADFADIMKRTHHAEFLRETADAWNDAIDDLTYVTGTPLARKHGVAGYYVRMMPPRRTEVFKPDNLQILMPNNSARAKHPKAIDIVSPDALALVRFGLRAADDTRIVDTVCVIDATLKSNTRTGPAWTRSSRDSYGEKRDGAPFKKSGIGRGWPLLAGERCHYEIAAGNPRFALNLLKTMTRQTSECGMIPEQVWNARNLPNRFLFNGHPAGSGMPLVWAHSEYIKLLRSLHGRKVWDMPPQAVERYQKQKKTAPFQIWTAKQPRNWMLRGKDLRVDLKAPCHVSWDCQGKTHEVKTDDNVFGLYCARLETAKLPSGVRVEVSVVPVEKNELQKRARFSVQIHESNKKSG